MHVVKSSRVYVTHPKFTKAMLYGREHRILTTFGSSPEMTLFYIKMGGE